LMALPETKAEPFNMQSVFARKWTGDGCITLASNGRKFIVVRAARWAAGANYQFLGAGNDTGRR
jgi:hypothetical protein